jgi:protoheme IX farnesyltransferase
MYREDYARGGLRMLPIVDPAGGRTAVAMIVTAALLLAASLLPVALGTAGWAYATGAVLLGAMFVLRGVQFYRDRTDRRARRVLRASLVYLPGVLGLLMIDALLL